MHLQCLSTHSKRDDFHKTLEEITDDESVTSNDSFAFQMNDSSLKVSAIEEEEELWSRPTTILEASQSCSLKKFRNSFRKVPMSWLPHSSKQADKEDLLDADDDESLRELMAGSRTMSDYSFKPQESLDDSMEWDDQEDLGDLTRSPRSRGLMRDCSFKPDESIGQIGNGSLTYLDISIQEPSLCQRLKNNQATKKEHKTITKVKEMVEDSTFGRNMGFLQHVVEKSTFVRNMNTISLLFTGK